VPCKNSLSREAKPQDIIAGGLQLISALLTRTGFSTLQAELASGTSAGVNTTLSA